MKEHFVAQDEVFMKRALNLAIKGRGFVSPNPLVGAVAVKNGEVVAQMWHKKYGGPHAEAHIIEILKKKKISAREVTLYLTLEPCVDFAGKKTGSCAAAIVTAGFKRIVVAIKDQNPRVNGKGITLLWRSGLKIQIGLCAQEAHEMNKGFSLWIKENMPFVAIKIGMSLDGKIATRTGESKWITGEKSRIYVRQLRDQYDAIVVGKNTVIKDNPELAGATRQPLRVVLDSTLSISPSARVFRDANAVVFTTEKAEAKRRQLFNARGIALQIFKKNILINPLLRNLAARGVTSVFVEGGSQVFGSFIDAKAVNRAYIFIAPKFIGGSQAQPAVSGIGVSKLSQALHFKKMTSKKIGEDILIVAQ